VSFFIDSHCHIDPKYYEIPIEEPLESCRQAGVGHMILIGATGEMESNYRALEISKVHPEISPTIGIHPHDTDSVTEEQFSQLVELSKSSEVVGIGESGFDFHYNNSSEQSQVKWCYRFTDLAIKLNKPIVLHVRDAESHLLKYFNDFKGSGLEKGVVHCFTGTEKEARAALDNNFYISFSGILTFKKSQELRYIAKFVPLDKTLIETDSPYLSPTPYRGKKNKPSYVVEVAKTLSEIHQVPLEKIEKVTYNNTCKVFSLFKN